MAIVPEGFQKIDSISPFMDLIGLLYERRDLTGITVGFQVSEKQGNTRGIVHGGMICPLADFVHGIESQRSTEETFNHDTIRRFCRKRTPR